MKADGLHNNPAKADDCRRIEQRHNRVICAFSEDMQPATAQIGKYRIGKQAAANQRQARPENRLFTGKDNDFSQQTGFRGQPRALQQARQQDGAQHQRERQYGYTPMRHIRRGDDILNLIKRAGLKAFTGGFGFQPLTLKIDHAQSEHNRATNQPKHRRGE